MDGCGAPGLRLALFDTDGNEVYRVHRCTYEEHTVLR